MIGGEKIEMKQQLEIQEITMKRLLDIYTTLENFQ
jgi:hypothetical protein